MKRNTSRLDSCQIRRSHGSGPRSKIRQPPTIASRRTPSRPKLQEGARMQMKRMQTTKRTPTSHHDIRMPLEADWSAYFHMFHGPVSFALKEEEEEEESSSVSLRQPNDCDDNKSRPKVQSGESDFKRIKWLTLIRPFTPKRQKFNINTSLVASISVSDDKCGGTRCRATAFSTPLSRRSFFLSKANDDRVGQPPSSVDPTFGIALDEGAVSDQRAAPGRLVAAGAGHGVSPAAATTKSHAPP